MHPDYDYPTTYSYPGLLVGNYTQERFGGDHFDIWASLRPALEEIFSSRKVKDEEILNKTTSKAILTLVCGAQDTCKLACPYSYTGFLVPTYFCARYSVQ